MPKLSATQAGQLPSIASVAAAPVVPRLVTPGMATPGRLSGALPLQSADPAKIAKAAHDFEAMALGQLLKPMFDTVDRSQKAFGGGPGEEAWKPMLVQEFAKQIAAHGGLGLAKPVYDAMLRMQKGSSK